MRPGATRNRQANRRSARADASATVRCAGPGIARPFFLGMRGAGGPLDVGSRTGARVNALGGFESIERCFVERRSLRLNVRRPWPSDIGPLIPLEAQPAQVEQRPFPGLVTSPRGIEVLDSKDHAPAGMPRGQPGDQKGPGVTEVETARWGGGQTAHDTSRKVRFGDPFDHALPIPYSRTSLPLTVAISPGTITFAGIAFPGGAMPWCQQSQFLIRKPRFGND